jgi:hypothetical protein
MIYCTQFVDDIFIIYNQNIITPELLLEQFGKQHKALQFTITKENNKQISYLDLNLKNKQGTVEIDIYRKPTATDIMLNNTSCHPGKHQMAIFKSWINRLQKLPLNRINKNKELNTIINIAENSGYNKKQIVNLNNQIKHDMIITQKRNKNR